MSARLGRRAASERGMTRRRRLSYKLSGYILLPGTAAFRSVYFSQTSEGLSMAARRRGRVAVQQRERAAVIARLER